MCDTANEALDPWSYYNDNAPLFMLRLKYLSRYRAIFSSIGALEMQMLVCPFEDTLLFISLLSDPVKLDGNKNQIKYIFLF